MVHDERSLVTLPRSECVALLRTASVGRVVFTERALPAIMPVTYGVLDEDIVLCTEPRSRLERAARDGVLAFEVDEIDPTARTGWSVVVTGLPRVVTEPAGIARALEVLDPWVTNRRGLVIRIPGTIVTGRRLIPDDAALWVGDQVAGQA